jgi:hypothetical protein
LLPLSLRGSPLLAELSKGEALPLKIQVCFSRDSGS